MSATPKRRTQAERREGTIRKLMDAATDTLIDFGYAEASVQRICDRAELSHGALFRHFKTTDELLIAVGQDVGSRMLERYRGKFSSLGRGEDRLATAIRLLRDTCRSKLNQAWYELVIAARTNATLNKALEPVAKKYFADIVALAKELMPEVAAATGAAFPTLVRTVVCTFDGEVLQRITGKLSREEDEARVQMLAAVVKAATRS